MVRAALVFGLLIPVGAWRAPLPRASGGTRAVHLRAPSTAAARCGRATGTLLGLTNEDVTTLFSVANFAPQPFWLLMILAPRWSVTRAVMRPWWPVLGLALVHLVIVVASASQDDGTAPIAEFANVFSTAPDADPQGAMVRMMRFPNFVSEEWSHVLTWDLLVGRLVWADALARAVPGARASVFLTNVIGPPGLLLHCAMCVLSGKGLPPVPALTSSPPFEPAPPPAAGPARDVAAAEPAAAAASASAFLSLPALLPFLGGGRAASRAAPPASAASVARADEVVRAALDGQAFDAAGLAALSARLDDAVVWEDLTSGPAGGDGALRGREAVLRFLAEREGATPAGCALRLERVADGARSTGFTWLRTGAQGERGLRGVGYAEVDPCSGKLLYVAEVAEPLFKPGSATAVLLKAVAKPAAAAPPVVAYTKRRPTSASALVRYLWEDVRGSDLAESVSFFSNAITYEDLNFGAPFQGKAAAEAFLREFDIPGITFVPDRISDGELGCAFTWRVAIEGVDGRQIRGISFYELDAGSRELAYVRDVPEPAFRPAPLAALAAALRPGLRKLTAE
jgi:hypothetical protein